MHQNTISTCSEGSITSSPKSVTVAERCHLSDATVNKMVKIWHQEVSSIGYGLASLTVIFELEVDFIRDLHAGGCSKRFGKHW